VKDLGEYGGFRLEMKTHSNSVAFEDLVRGKPFSYPCQDGHVVPCPRNLHAAGGCERGIFYLTQDSRGWQPTSIPIIYILVAGNSYWND
jgi:hypothetical protein